MNKFPHEQCSVLPAAEFCGIHIHIISFDFRGTHLSTLKVSIAIFVQYLNTIWVNVSTTARTMDLILGGFI